MYINNSNAQEQKKSISRFDFSAFKKLTVLIEKTIN